MVPECEYEYDYEWNLMAHCVTRQSPLERGVYLSGSNTEEPSLSTPPVPVPTIVIWHSPSCNACLNSEPLFAALEANTDGFVVERRMATPDVIQTMVDSDGHQHITMLPLYDIIRPEVGSDSLYGKDLRLDSVRNNDVQELTRYVPSLTLVTRPSQ